MVTYSYLSCIVTAAVALLFTAIVTITTILPHYISKDVPQTTSIVTTTDPTTAATKAVQNAIGSSTLPGIVHFVPGGLDGVKVRE